MRSGNEWQKQNWDLRLYEDRQRLCISDRTALQRDWQTKKGAFGQLSVDESNLVIDLKTNEHDIGNPISRSGIHAQGVAALPKLAHIASRATLESSDSPKQIILWLLFRLS